jgi:uncharacterized protein YuzE
VEDSTCHPDNITYKPEFVMADEHGKVIGFTQKPAQVMLESHEN